jgi:hypothetical protein
MTSVSITSSIYRAEKFLPSWSKSVLAFAQEAKEIGLNFEINAIANDPTPAELTLLLPLTEHPWFHLHQVPREPIYASWNRGVAVANAAVCTSWNVDDIRNAIAIKDGLGLIADNKTSEEHGVVVYFPFVYKRYINIFDHDFLVKRITVRPPAFEKQEFIQSMHIGPFFLFTKKAHERIGGFDEKYTIVGDYEWQARAAKNDVCFLQSAVVSGIFTNNGKTLSGSRSVRHSTELQEVFRMYNPVQEIK